jgi:hypothetical protein
VGFFRAIADAMLIVIGWVLWIAPIGVFALAFVVGARAGGGAFGALLHYVLIVMAVGSVIWLSAWLVALFGAGIGPGRFTRAIAPAQAVAFSTQSSLATLPTMLKAAEKLDVPTAASGVSLPMAVAVFRATSPAMNLAVAIYIAYWFGYELTWAQMAIGVAAAATTTMGSVGIPGQASFITSIAPICLAMGLPIEPLALLIAVEVLPDLIAPWAMSAWTSQPPPPPRATAASPRRKRPGRGRAAEGKRLLLPRRISVRHLALLRRAVAVPQARLAVLQALLDAIDPHRLDVAGKLQRVAVPDHHVAAPARAQRADLPSSPIDAAGAELIAAKGLAPAEAGGSGTLFSATRLPAYCGIRRIWRVSSSLMWPIATCTPAARMRPTLDWVGGKLLEAGRAGRSAHWR